MAFQKNLSGLPEGSSQDDAAMGRPVGSMEERDKQHRLDYV